MQLIAPLRIKSESNIFRSARIGQKDQREMKKNKSRLMQPSAESSMHPFKMKIGSPIVVDRRRRFCD